MSSNPYASGEAALPATEAAASAPKIAIVAAVLAGLALLGIAGFGAIIYSWQTKYAVPDRPQYMALGALTLAVALFSLVGLLLGAGALFVRNRPRTVAAIATFTNAAILLVMVALFTLSYQAFGGLD